MHQLLRKKSLESTPRTTKHLKTLRKQGLEDAPLMMVKPLHKIRLVGAINQQNLSLHKMNLKTPHPPMHQPLSQESRKGVQPLPKMENPLHEKSLVGRTIKLKRPKV